MSLTPATDEDLVSNLAKSANATQQYAAMRTVAAGLACLSCVDGLSLLVATITARSILHESPGLDNLADNLTELLPTAKYADLR